MKTCFVGVAVFLCVYTARALEDTQPVTHSLNVFPSSVTTDSWKNIDALYSQDNGSYDIYQAFRKSTSAYLEKPERVETLDASVSAPSDDATVLPSSDAGDTTTPGESLENGSEVPNTNDTASSPPQEETPSAEPDPPSADEPQPVSFLTSPLRHLSTSLSRVFARAETELPLALEAVTDSPQGGESSTAPEAAPSESFGAESSTVIPEDVPAEGEAIDVVSKEEMPSPQEEIVNTVSSPDELSSSTELAPATSQGTELPCGQSCAEHAITLEGFALPELGSGESIHGAEIRVSLAGRLVRQNTEGRLVVSYRMGGSWYEAGDILLRDEVSNALNGGYFLFALPDIHDVNELGDIALRIRFEGDVSDIDGLYIDSAWIELNILSLSEEALRARVSPEALPLVGPRFHDLLSSQVDFTLGEMPAFTLRYHEQRNFIVRFLRSIFANRVADIAHVSLVHNDSGDVGVTPSLHATEDGLFTVQIDESDRERMRPGLYTLSITVAEGSVEYTDTFEFQWGLLAQNSDKSEYVVGETATLSFAALSPNGNTLCDAQLLAYVIEPDGFIRNLPIDRSSECNGNSVVSTPDYSALYTTHATGTHTVYIERLDETGNVVAHTEDVFEVAEDAPIAITRHGATRIYPVSPYVMEFTVTSREAFTGTVRDRVPSTYFVSDTDATESQSGEEKILTWDVAMDAGESRTFRYTFDAPDISPYLYRLGPAEVLVDDGTETVVDTTIPTEGTASSTPLDATSVDDQILEPAPVTDPLTFGAPTALPLAQESVVVNEDIAPQASETTDTTSTDEILPLEIAPVSPDSPALLQNDGASSTEARVPTTETVANSSPQKTVRPFGSFIEKRKWQIASDATGSMIVYWTSAASIPSGWSCISCISTDPFYQKFARGSTTYSGTAAYGVSTSTHSASGTVYTSSLANSESGGSTDISTVSHTHTLTPDIAASTTVPVYRNLRVIQYSSAGEPASIPAGAVLMFDSTLPSGWTQYSAHNDYYLRGENTVGGTGGNNTHRHQVTGTTTAASGATVQSRTGGTQVTASAFNHTHTISTSTGLTSNEPPYREVILATTSSATGTPVGAITLWTDTPPTAWTSVSGASGDAFFERFAKASTTYGGTGGASTHTHSDITSITSSAASGTDNGRTGSTGSDSTHTHLTDVTSFSQQSHLPPYVDVIFAKRLEAVATYTQSAFKWYVNNSTSTTPTDVWPQGATDLAQNEYITATGTPVDYGEVVRLRIALANSVATATAATFKMQYGSTTSSCTAISSWSDVGGSTSTAEWRGYDNASLTDGSTLSSTTLSITERLESYEETNPSTSTPTDISPGEDGEWDFVLQHNSSYPAATYCFRLVKSDGTVLYSYSTYPSLYTNNTPTVTLEKLFDNEKVATVTPTFTFYAVDPEDDEVDYQIQIDNDYGFGSTAVDLNSESSLLFQNLVTPSDKSTFYNAELMSVRPTTALTDGTTYYWRVRSKDTGSDVWGSWSTIRSFTIDTSLTASAWFQTESDQFRVNTNVGISTSSNQMTLAVGSTTGTSTSQAIDFADGDAGNAWGSLSWNDNETTGDIKYKLQYEVSTGVWADIPDSALSGNSSGFDTSPVSLLGLDTATYSRLRLVAIFTNSGGAPILSDWTLSWGYRIETPTLSMPFANEKVATTTPTFEFTTTDPQDDDLVYEIQWSTTYAFTASTTRVSSSSSGFSNYTTATDTSPFYSGDTIRFTVASGDALTNGTTYWWRVRAIDPFGNNSYSFYTDPRSLTVDTSVTVSTWFQTTASQFDIDTLSGVVSAGDIATVATTADESLIVYGEGTQSSPRYRDWNGSLWSDESTLSSVGVVPNWVVTRASPTREEYLAGMLGGDGDVNIQVFADGAWGDAIEVTTSVPDTDMRAFDIAYENSSGDAIVAYCDGDADPSYYVWNGSSWTSGGTINLASTNNCGWIKLISDPTSDEIIVVSRDVTGTQYEAQVWSGSTWGNSTTLGSMTETSHEGIAAAYEDSGNQAVVAVSDGNFNRFSWTAWNGTSWSAAATQALGNDLEWASLASDDGSDNMALCYVDDDNDIGVVRWTGAAWTGQTELEISGASKDSRSVDCAYETTASRDGYIMFVYSDLTNMRYQTWNGTTWSGELSVSTIADTPILQVRRLGTGLIQAIGLDDTNDRYDTSYWNGSSWSTLETLETDASVAAAPFKEPFMIAPRNPGTTGSLRGAPMIDFTEGDGPYWQQLSWTDTEPSGTSILYQVEYYNSASGTWSLVPDSLIPQNSTGTSTSPIDLSNVLPVTTYRYLRPVANMTCNLGVCPTLSDWTLTWAAGVTISGTAQQYDQSTNVTSGTVAVALNGVLQTGRTGSISGGTWSIANVNAAPGDVITVFISGATDSSEAVGVTTYDGVGNVSGINLYERHLSIGSDDRGTTTNAGIGLYDFSQSEDLFMDVDAGNDLALCATTGCGDARLIIKAGNVYQPGSGADISVHDIFINGTFLPNGNTIRVSGSWDNNATATMATSTLIFTATSTTETFDDTGAVFAPAYYNLTFGEGSGTATWTLGSALNVDGALSTTYGTLARSSFAITVAGNLTNGSGGLWTGVATTTLDGSAAATWTDNAATKQDMGYVVIDGASKSVTLGSNVTARSVTIASDDILDASATGYDITVLRHWTNNNTFTARTGEVIFAATTSNATITQGNSNFYDLTFSGVGGTWAFTGSALGVTNNFTVSTGTVTLPTGTTTVAGSWNSTGGLFAHNNGGVAFSATGAKTITLGGGTFTNTFYDLAFTGTGSWSFVDSNATTSNDLFISAGTVTFPSGVMALGGSLVKTGGTLTANSGTLQLTSSLVETIRLGSSALASVLFTGTGSWSYVDTNVTVSQNYTVVNGTSTLPSGTLTLGGSFSNTGTFAHNSGTILFDSTATGKTISPGSSWFYNLTFNSATGGWTISSNATSSNNVTLTAAGSFTLSSGIHLSVGSTFSNSVGGASTTWTGSTLSLVSGTSYSVNSKTAGGDAYGTIHLGANTHIALWNSSADAQQLGTNASIYSQDHAAQDGDLYIYGTYSRTSGTEYWSYGTDFDGTALTASTSRQVDVRFASGASAALTNTTLSLAGTSTASTTVAALSGTYTLSVTGGTTTASHYTMTGMDSNGLQLLGATAVSSLADGAFTVTTAGGTGITVSSTTIDANAALQIYRVSFATSSAIAATNVTQSDGTPTSYWWFRESSGNLGGEDHDADTGDPGSIRWDDSNLVITVSGTVYGDDGATPLSAPTCDDATPVVTVVVDGGTSYSGSCASADGTYSVPGVVIAGDPVLTVYLNTNGGVRGTTVTRTPTGNVTGLDLLANRVVVTHEDVTPLSIANMAVFDEGDDTDIRFVAATGSVHTLTVRPDTELHIASSSTFEPQGTVTIESGGSGFSYDGSLHVKNSATLTLSGTSTLSVGGSFTVDSGATFSAASTTVDMTATTSGKTITTPDGQTITFNTLRFSGSGGWSIDGDIAVVADMEVNAGTVSGVSDITISYGSLSGNGTVAFTSGTTTIARTNTLGGSTPWTFYNLTLGSGSVVGTTTPPSSTTTISGVLRIANAHVLDAGSSQWNLSGSGTPFVVSGTFAYGTSLIRYSATSSANITSASYYHIDLNASAGTPTYTGIGLGINIYGDLTVGGSAPTTVNLTTNDPALNVDGGVTIRANGTLIASNSGSATIGGSWDNDGIFTHSGGTVTFDSGTNATIYAGTSWFSSVVVNKAGSLTVSEHATASSAFTLTAASAFTVDPSVSLAVGGTFTNSVGGAATTWTNSTLALYSGTNYTINASTTNDSYGTLVVAQNTDVRMWNSGASTITVDASGSLYSMDHAAVDGSLYIYGDYVKSSGTDYWSYATDFDGTALGGSSRAVTVSFAPNATATLAGGTLTILGGATATTTLTNQGSGTYALAVTSGTVSAQYYRVRNINAAGMNFSGTPTVSTLSFGDIEIGVTGGTGITVAGTVIDQNPAKTFTVNTFATSSGVSSAYNVTATGSTVSSWRFTNHMGALAGENFDNDPDGDPGYIVWDDSAAQLTISGVVYSDEGSTLIGGPTCDGSTQNVHLRVGGLTSYTTSCSATSSAYSIANVAYSPGDTIVAYLDTNGGAQAAVVTVDPISNIANMHLYQNRVIVRHEGTNPLTIDDMALWDSSDDADIPFTALSGSPDTLTLPANRKLIVWNSKTFAPGGNVTLSGGGGGAAYDGTLELYSNAAFTAAGTESHSIGGSLITGSGASITGAQATFTLTSSGSSRTVDTNDGTLYNLTFNGSGSFVITDTALSIGNTFTITQGSVTLPSGTTTIGASFVNTGGSFAHASGTLYFTATSGGKTIQPGSSVFHRLVFNGSGGAWSFVGGYATATKEFLVSAGTVTLPSGVLAVMGPLDVTGGALTHNSGTISLLATTSSTTLRGGGSTFNSLTFGGAGSYIMQDTNPTLLGTLSITNGSVVLATGTITIGGSFTNTGGSFTHSTGTILFNSSDVGETINPGSSTFHNVSLASPTGGWTVSQHATTTGNFSLTSAASFSLSSSTALSVAGVFTNTVGGASTTWTGSTLFLLGSTTYTINTKTQGGDNYGVLLIASSTDIRMWNSAASTTTVDPTGSLYSQDHSGVDGALAIYGDYVRTSGSDYWSYATDFDGTSIATSSRVVSVAFAANATATYSGATLAIVGASGATTTVTNQGSGTFALVISDSALSAQYAAFRNMNSDGLSITGLSTISALAYADFELAVSGGSLITVSSSTVNANTGSVLAGLRFATTTAITGYNIELVGSTTGYWTLSGEHGNLSGEAYDVDGADACGSLRWSNSSCLITEQTHYRWRNDDGGEGVPNTEWYDANWGKRRRVAITNADAVGYVNAVVEVPVSYDTDMQADFDDLRFTSEDGTTLLSHYREVYTSGTEATVWVEVPLLATSTITNIYMYYGNGGASDVSTSTTFVFLENVEDGSLAEYSGDTGEFTTSASAAYERSYKIVASDPDNGQTASGGMYNNSYSVAQGQTIRYFQYIDATQTGDESCTTFGTQSQTTNYAVCLELFGVDRMSLVKDAKDRDLSGTVLASTTVTYSTGWYEVEIDWHTDDSIYVSLYQNDTLVATTTATDSSYTSGGMGYTLWTYHGAWDMLTSRTLITTEPSVSISVEQVAGGASWYAARDTSASGIAAYETKRLRFAIQNGGLPIANQQFELEFASKGASPSCEAVSYNDYTAVPIAGSCGTSPVCMGTSTQFANQASTTDLLLSDGTFTYGKIVQDSSNITNALSVGTDEFTEVEYALTVTSYATSSNYCLRVSNNGSSLDSYAKVAELGLRFDPTITSWSLNNGEDITLSPGTTTAVYATGTVQDQNGYSDLLFATSTIYRSGVGATCSADNNNCYRLASTSCTLSNCSGNSCDVSCVAYVYFFADPTDAGTYSAEDWRADLFVSDTSSGNDTQSTFGSDLLTLRALEVDSSIPYGSLEVDSDTGSYNATTTVENIGNDAIDVELSGTDLSDGVMSVIPVSEQKYATSTFTYSSCVYCTALSTTGTNYEIDLSKPTTTTPVLSDYIYWGIHIPFGSAAAQHSGTNTFTAIGD